MINNNYKKMNLFQEIKKNINTFNNEDINIKPKIKVESNYILDQFNIRERKIEYYKFISKNKKEIKNEHETRVFNNANEFMDALEKKRYMKKWNRLDDYAKKIKYNEFFEKWLIDNPNIKLTPNELTNKMIIGHSLNKRYKIDYDEVNCVILSIDKLEEHIK
jgi:hypothetical protein